jgi:hypothetical protein
MEWRYKAHVATWIYIVQIVHIFEKFTYELFMFIFYKQFIFFELRLKMTP